MMRSTHQTSHVGIAQPRVVRWDRIAAVLAMIALVIAFIIFIIATLDATYGAIIERACTTYRDAMACQEMSR